ncbi:MAG: glycine zipper family protein [Xenococcus sp. (in: cyanobacteria)]
MNKKTTANPSILTAALMGLTMAILNSAPVKAQFIYPQQGQSPQQQQNDEIDCSNWATQQTGYRPSGSSGSDEGIISNRALRGAARGAGIGAISGAIGGDAGTGAAIGGAVGGVSGGIRNHDEKSRRNEFDRAFATCMTGRGYTVN